MHLAMEKRGEQFVRDTITEVFARRGKAVMWSSTCSSRREEAPRSNSNSSQSLVTSAPTAEIDSATDPMGAPLPDVTI
jgi:hypothetical protein